MTAHAPPVFVEGAAMEISWADASRNLMELIFDTVRAAIDDAGVAMDGIDSVVLGAHDLVDGRSLTSMVTAPAAAAYMRDEVRLSDDGLAALAVGVARLEAGHNTRTIVAAWGRASEHDTAAVARALFDPAYHRALGLTELSVAAMRAQQWLTTNPDQPDRAAAARRRAQAASSNPRAVRSDTDAAASLPYPLGPTEGPAWADVVAALVLSGENTPIRIAGMGQSSEIYWPGDRHLVAMPALSQASSRALAEAGTGLDEVDVVELDGQTIFDEAIGLEAIGLAKMGMGLRHLAEDERCNPSGGGAAGWCAPGMGLVRAVEAVLQLRGAAGAVQRQGVRRAMATGSSTVAGQTQTAVVLERA